MHHDHDHDHSHDHHNVDEKMEYVKFSLLIIGIFVISTLLSFNSSNFYFDVMKNFMGAFFVIFSLFKIFSLKEFASTYMTYDLLAQRSREYAYTYPFIELALGISYFVISDLFFINLFTLILMIVSGIGVLTSLRQNRNFQCACLGNFIKLPLSKITLIEDFGMAAMALFMLII